LRWGGDVFHQVSLSTAEARRRGNTEVKDLLSAYSSIEFYELISRIEWTRRIVGISMKNPWLFLL
jgi:hypothetical protein